MANDCLMLRCCHLHRCLGQVPVIRGISFPCCPGQWMAVGGACGAASSILESSAARLCPPGGRIWALAPLLGGDELDPLAGRIGTLGDAEARAATSPMVEPSVELSLLSAGLPREVLRRRAEEWQECRGLERKLNRLSSPVRLLVLDEPTRERDCGAVRIVMEAIGLLVDLGATVLIPAHDANGSGQASGCHLEVTAGARVDGRCR